MYAGLMEVRKHFFRGLYSGGLYAGGHIFGGHFVLKSPLFCFKTYLKSTTITISTTTIDIYTCFRNI